MVHALQRSMVAGHAVPQRTEPLGDHLGDAARGALGNFLNQCRNAQALLALYAAAVVLKLAFQQPK